MKTKNRIAHYTAPTVCELSVRLERGFAVSTDAWGDKELNPWGTTQTNDYNE